MTSRESGGAFRVAVRADASAAVGTGHVFRCAAICDELRRRGGTALFICRETPGHLGEALREWGYEVRLIPEDPARDAEASAEALRGAPPVDWLIVDHYGLGAEWERAMRPFAPRLLALDDLADRPHEVDALLDYTNQDPALYARLVPPQALRLVGAAYVPLRREFLETPPLDLGEERPRRLLVTLGGNDPGDFTSRVLEALTHPAFADLEAEITVGLSNPRLDKLRGLAARRPGLRLHAHHPRPSELMARCGLCLGAGGVTSWERCRMGLPTLAVALAEHQEGFLRNLERSGALRYLGPAEALTVEDLRTALAQALADGVWRREASGIGKRLVDGLGAARVLDALAGALAAPFEGGRTWA